MDKVRGLTRAAIALGILLAWCRCALSLDPSLVVDQYAHTAWRVRDGFPKGVVYAITQTPDGYLWLGTEFGLLRFDGVRAVAWHAPRGAALPSSYIRSLFAARDGGLWIGTSQGLASWKDGTLTLYPELAGETVLALTEDREGTVWAGGWAVPSGRLCAISGHSIHCVGQDGVFGQGVAFLYSDSRGTLWARAESGLWQWKPSPERLYAMPHPKTNITGLSEDDSGAILISANSGISQFVGGKLEPKRFGSDPFQFRPSRLLRDRDGGLWSGTTDLGLLHVHEGRTDVFTPSQGLSGDFITALFEDREGNMWVATLDGLDRFSDSIVHTLWTTQGLSNALVWSVLGAKDGSVWLGTPEGLNRWKDGQVWVYRKRNVQALPRGITREQSPRESSESRQKGARGATSQTVDTDLPEDGVGSLFEDDQGRIWISTLRGIGFLENGRFVPVNGLPDSYAYSIVGDPTGNVWISENQGLFHVLRDSAIERFPWSELGRKDPAMTLLMDPVRGGLWLGFRDGGLVRFKDGQIRQSYMVADGLGDGSVMGLQTGRDGELWAATAGGLSRVQIDPVSISTLTAKNGLPCDKVHWAVEDDAHALWLLMPCGLVRVARTELNAWVQDPKRTVRVAVFDESDGVRTHAVTSDYSPRVARSRDGKLWFLPFDGVSVVDPRHLALNAVAPPVYIEQLTADRKAYGVSSHVQLPPLVRDVTLSFTALSFLSPEKILFRYRLEGQDRDWGTVLNTREVHYSNLSPGAYRFRVTAANNSGVWNERGDVLAFSIAPAYWQTNWFRTLCLVAFIALLWLLYRLRVRQVARSFELALDARVAERTRIARELHDSLLQGVQGLIIRLHAVRELLPGRPADAALALKGALRCADQAVAEGRAAVQDLRATNLAESELPEALMALGPELVPEGAEQMPSYRVVVEGKRRSLALPVRDDGYRIAREAVRNAVQHARARHIEVELVYGETSFCVRVRDDGVGIDSQTLEAYRRPGHWGLPGMYERAESFGAHLEVWSEHGAGTEVLLEIPAAVAYGRGIGRTSAA